MISMHKSGDIIYKAQDKPKSIFIIHSGSIEILTKSGVPLATLNEGEIFGEISEILAENRSVTARAKTDCSLMHIEISTIESKLQTTDPAIKGIIRALALRLSETSRKYEALWDELQIYKSLKPK
ncbi:MAG: cyclic nucleotide-binding domain-containing protein [Paracoccaceae bacterium]|nr:cAMP-binding protein [Marinovum sp.]MDG2295284.1 cyclic nucleotide-binding domain-containing protein [Paracoccaceae bacterium]